VAIATGLAEWCDTTAEPKRVGAAHAVLNTIGFSTYVVALGLRLVGRRRAGIACAMLGYAVSSVAAYLGGELSTGFQIGVKHIVTPIFPPEEFAAVLAEADLVGHEPKLAEFSGIPILLSRDRQGEIHAISAVCTHRGAPLETGTFTDDCVTCPWHGARFTLADGRVQEGPATFPLARFATRVVAGHIEVRPYFA
jgi:nitrite reductase/ring-hydroxylating ferredoxin subunit